MCLFDEFMMTCAAHRGIHKAPSSTAHMAQCRFCLAEGEDLVAPCECRGSQRWVHLSCLRRWQRAVLVTQPTHPALIQVWNVKLSH